MLGSRTRLHASWCRVAAMSARRLLIPALVIALLPACGDKPSEAEPGKPAVAVEPGKATTPVDKPTDSEVAPTPAAAGDEDTETGDAIEPVPEEFESVGVESCDQYVASYVACINEKVPEAE